MRQAVKEGGRQIRFSKNLCPICTSKIGRHDHRAAFMTLSQYLKEQFRPGFRKRDVASLVENQQVITDIALEQAT